MNGRRSLIRVLLLGLLLAPAAGLTIAQGPTPPAPPLPGTGGDVTQAVLGTAFTYQGRLTDGGSPANGDYDFQFKLYDAASGGTLLGTVTVNNQAVADGRFTVALDFGSGAFDGTARYLAIGVRAGSSTGAYTALTPRQPLTPAPYALALPGLWTQQTATSPNLIGGYSGNHVTAGVEMATISGGGESGYVNRVTDYGGTVGGGGDNLAGDDAGTTGDASAATVGGGWGNAASGEVATVGGGYNNLASDGDSTIGGGNSNTASGWGSTVGGGAGNTASGYGAVIAGGGGWDGGTSSPMTNTASADWSTIGGGVWNTASGYGSTVGGGRYNTASDSSSTVGGGRYNTASDSSSTVGGGSFNTASGSGSTVGGGVSNTASGTVATVGGGEYNTASDDRATVGGGYLNTASGYQATVPGGYDNAAQGTDSFAAGQRARANHNGAFVWADDSNLNYYASSADNQFRARASGGVYFHSNSAASVGVYLAPGANAWTNTSDRNWKENFAPVDGQEVLARLAKLPITTWNLKSQDPSIRHMGPMAQDFYAAFGIGEDELHISTVDADGVALAAIQGLHTQNQALAAENAALRRQVDDLETRMAALEARVANGTASESGFPPGAGLLLAGLVLSLPVGLVWMAWRGGGVGLFRGGGG